MWEFAFPSEEVALPVTGYRAVFDTGGPLADRHRIDDLPARLAGAWSHAGSDASSGDAGGGG